MQVIKVISALFLGLISFSSYSQIVEGTFTTRTSEGGSDAMVASGVLENKNFKGNKRINTFQKNAKHNSVVFRSYLNFDLSSIPANAIIIDATLLMSPKKVNNKKDHPIYVEKVTSTWDRTTLKWINQPEASSVGSFLQTHSATIDETVVHQYDIKNLVQDLVNYPNDNHGIRMRLENENLASKQGFGVRYHSSRADSSNFHPKLVLHYVLPVEITTSVTHCTQGSNDGLADITISGGSGTYSQYWLYKVNAHPTAANAQQSTFISGGPIVENTISVQNLDAGLYVLRTSNPDYSGFTYRHFLIGREGETTDAIIASHVFIDQTRIAINFGADAAINDFSNIPYGPVVSALHVGTTGTNSYGGSNAYHTTGLLDFNLDVAPDLEIQSADLYMLNHFTFQRYATPNDTKFSAILSDWDQDFVTWSTRPIIDSNSSVILGPSPNPNGHSNVMDTLDIVSLMEYWQTSPNNGIEIALLNYETPTSVFRSERKIGNGSYFKFSFTVKSPLTATYDESLEEGTISVEAPDGELPYTYLLSYEPIPDLTIIWNSIKDSIPLIDSIPITDSLKFFQGKKHSTQFEFNGLSSGRYYVAVFDNNGQEVLQQSTILSPEFYLGYGTDIIKTAGFYSKDPLSQNDANGVLAITFSKEESGGLTFKLKDIDEGLFGFTYKNDTIINDSTDILFGIHVINSTEYTIIENGIEDSQNLFSINNKDEFSIGREGNKFVLYQENVKQIEKEFSLNEDIKMNIKTKGLIKFSPLFPWGGWNTLKPEVIINYPECGELVGDLSVSLPFTNFVATISNLGVDLKDINGVTISPSQGDSYQNLPIGIYTLTLTWNTSYFWSNLILPGSSVEEIAIGYVVDWSTSATTQVDPGSLNTITTTTFNNNGQSYSNYKTVNGDDNWVQFESLIDNNNFYILVNPPLKYQRFELVPASNTAPAGTTALGLLNHNWGFFPETIVYGTNLQFFNINPNNEFRIHQNNTGIEIFDVGNTTPFYTNITSPIAGNQIALYLRTHQYRHPFYKKTISSFCNSQANYYVAKTQKQLYGDYYEAVDKVIYFQYTGEYNESVLDYELLSPNGIPISIGSYTIDEINNQGQTLKKNADNRYKLMFGSGMSSGFYILKVTNIKGEEEFIRIKL